MRHQEATEDEGSRMTPCDAECLHKVAADALARRRVDECIRWPLGAAARSFPAERTLATIAPPDGIGSRPCRPKRSWSGRPAHPAGHGRTRGRCVEIRRSSPRGLHWAPPPASRSVADDNPPRKLPHRAHGSMMSALDTARDTLYTVAVTASDNETTTPAGNGWSIADRARQRRNPGAGWEQFQSDVVLRFEIVAY